MQFKTVLNSTQKLIKLRFSRLFEDVTVTQPSKQFNNVDLVIIRDRNENLNHNRFYTDKA